jgi:hypothetical protein
MNRKKKLICWLGAGIVLAAGPVWGVIGTVIGMVLAFVNLAQSQPQPEGLADNIRFVLYATMAGWVACPIGIVIVIVAVIKLGQNKQSVEKPQDVLLPSDSERPCALPKRFRGLFSWLTLYVIPMCSLIPVMAIFLVNHFTSPQWNSVIRVMFGQLPIYAEYSHALRSLLSIPMLGFAVFLLVFLVEMVVSMSTRISIGFHLFGAWVIGFIPSFGLWYLRWVRIRVENRTPLMIETGRAIAFGFVYALITYLATRMLMKVWDQE